MQKKTLFFLPLSIQDMIFLGKSHRVSLGLSHSISHVSLHLSMSVPKCSSMMFLHFLTAFLDVEVLCFSDCNLDWEMLRLLAAGLWSTQHEREKDPSKTS